MNKNRQACFWGPDGNFTTLSDQQSPFCVSKKFSPDGKKLLYFGGWQTEEEAGGAGKVFLVSTFCLSATILAMSTFDVSVNKRIDTTQIAWLMAACIWGGFVFGHAKRVL